MVNKSMPVERGPFARKIPALPAAVSLHTLGTGGLLLLFIALFIFVWYFCRIEPRPGEIAVLIKKTGKDLEHGAILAVTPEHKGIRLDVLPEGRYFRNPYTWGWKIHRITDIPAGKVGVLTRLYGKDLPPGRIIAGNDTKGIVVEVMRPGKYRINPYSTTSSRSIFRASASYWAERTPSAF